MSLILEALKKSEAERRLGQAPGLLSPTLPHKRQRQSMRWLLAIALVGVLLAGLGGWWLAQQTATPEPATAGAAGAASAGTGSGLAATPAPVEVPPAGGVLPLPPRDGTAAAPSPPAPTASAEIAPPSEPVARAPAPVGVPPPVTQQAPAPVPPSDPAFASIEREARALAAGAALPPAVSDATAPAPAAANANANASAAAARAAQTTAAAPTTAATAPAGDSLPALRQLPAATRESLPPLKLSMHVFAEAPAERFVLIDGRRYTEGASLGQGLVVEEIRRDGVVMAREGTRFLLPRPG